MRLLEAGGGDPFQSVESVNRGVAAIADREDWPRTRVIARGSRTERILATPSGVVAWLVPAWGQQLRRWAKVNSKVSV
jgi:hypothetical protein